MSQVCLLFAFVGLLASKILLAAGRGTLFPRCNAYNSACGLSPAQAQLKYLSSHASLIRTLRSIQREAKVPIEIGPLIRNGNNGLVNIDVPLDLKRSPVVKTDVCGVSNRAPTIRQAVICTVTKDSVLQPPRGNLDPSKIGASNHGRSLYAAVLGNRKGKRVFIVTQQHGNEASSTEAALTVLRILTHPNFASRMILRKLRILFLVRANPDGGEPSAHNSPAVGVPYNETAGFFRNNLDPAAGGGFNVPTEKDFFGVVGRGYDMNRYNYGGLDAAIRPVENQAIVATLHAFRPHVVFDAHGDQPKALCELDPATFTPGGAPVLRSPSVRCKPPAHPVPTLRTDRKSVVVGSIMASDASALGGEETKSLKSGAVFSANVRLVRSIAAIVMKRVGPRVDGTLTRFNQVQIGLAKFSGGLLDLGALRLSAVASGWEVLNHGTALRLATSSVRREGGKLVGHLGFDISVLDPCFLKHNICVNEHIMYEALRATARLVNRRLRGGNGFCAIPLSNGFVASFPASAGHGKSSTEDPIMIPQGGEFGVPIITAGRCAGDL